MRTGELWQGAPYEYSRSAHRLVFAAGACPFDPEGYVVAPLGVSLLGYPGQLVEIEAVARGR